MDVSQTERTEVFASALQQFYAVDSVTVTLDSEATVTITMDGHKTAVPRRLRELADVLGFDSPDVGSQSGGNYEYYTHTPTDGEDELITHMTFVANE